MTAENTTARVETGTRQHPPGTCCAGRPDCCADKAACCTAPPDDGKPGTAGNKPCTCACPS